MKNSISMTQFAATVADALGVPAPKAAGESFPLDGREDILGLSTHLLCISEKP